MRTGLLALLLLAIPSASPAQQSSDSAALVDRLFERWTSRETPGCAVGVARDGRTLLSRAYGMADLERDVAATPATIYEAGSVSKQFTAAAILLLQQQGRLTVDDDVRKYVPELPDYGTPVTIRHMMTHTSGLRDWGSVAGIAGWGRSVRTHTHDHVVDILSRQRALNFTPGGEYSYSNSGYNLLAVIVDRVSGMPFAEFTKRHIFEPLGMHATQWRDDHTRIVKGRSIAYAARGDGFVIDHPIENVHGNGGLLTTVGDLLTWNEALNTGAHLGGPAFVEAMHRQGVLNDGRQISYAAGLQVGSARGVRRVSHTGSTSGFRAFLARYPDQRLSVALLCNVGAVNPGTVGQRVADVFLPAPARVAATSAPAADSSDDAPAPRERFTPAAEDLAAYVGQYYSPDAETTLSVSLEEGRLVARRRPATRFALTPIERDAFGAGGGLGRVRFIRDAQGAVTQLSVSQGRVYDLRFERVRGAAAQGDTVTTASGLKYVFVQRGNGPVPQPGDLMVIHGIGRFTDGREFWNTRTDGTPYEYSPGVDRVIRGFEEGMQHVRGGDRIVIVMKPELGYGERGNRDIPPNSTLVFDYEILAVEPLSIARLLREGFAADGVDVTLARARARPDLAEFFASDGSLLAAANRAGRTERADAEKVLAFGLTLLPQSYRLHQALARAQAARGAVAEATASYEAALRYNPRSNDAQRRDADAATAALAELRAR
jgi:CubicO group peptidase (beta-lactamase class C family)